MRVVIRFFMRPEEFSSEAKDLVKGLIRLIGSLFEEITPQICCVKSLNRFVKYLIPIL